MRADALKIDRDALLAQPLSGRCPTSAAASVRSADVTYPRRWCRRSIGSRRACERVLPIRSSAPSSRRSCDLGGRPTPLTPRPRTVAALGRGGVAQARGPRAHRRAQDQQRHRPGAAREATGREAHRRRDRCGPAWRRLGRGLRARWAAVHGLHGSGRHGAAGAERRPHAAAGRRGGPGDERRSTLRAAIDEAIRDWVSDPDRHVLPAGLRGGPASVSVSRARVAVRDRSRGARADARAGRRAARRRRRLRRRRIERHRPVSCRSCAT